MRSFSKRYIVPYLPWYIAGAASLVVTNALSTTIPIRVADAIDALHASADPSTVVPAKAGIIALMGVSVIIVRTASRLLFFTPGRLVEAQLKRDLFAGLLRQQPPFLRRYPVGDLVSRATSDVSQVRLLAGFGILQVLNSVFALAFTMFQMIRLSPVLALATLIPVTVGFAVTQFSLRRFFELVHMLQKQAAQLSDHILSSYQGVATIHGFVAEDAFMARFNEVNKAWVQTNLTRTNLRTILGPALGLSASVNVFLLLYFGGPMAIAGTLTVGQLVAFTALVGLLINPLRATSFLVNIWKQAQVSIERLGDVMDPEPERPDLTTLRPAPIAPPALEVRDLTFAYPDAPGRPILEHLSFSLQAGQTLGILGATGSGKTTLLRCLSRLYNPPPGSVLVDGIDVTTIDLDDWRRRTALVPQRAFLFSEPLEDNVKMGAVDGGRLDRVLALTTLDVDITTLPQGKRAPVGESGIMLSGGQRQRVALARGLYAWTPDDRGTPLGGRVVLMLDDVLSAVDHATEHTLIETLHALSPRPTTIIVANRISAIQHAAVILVMASGHIVDQGTHEELIRRQGPYLETWQRQNDEGATP